MGKKRLVRALLVQTSAETSSSSTAAKGDGKDVESLPIANDGDNNNLDLGSPPSSSSTSLWTLDTRYYTATLSLERSRIAGDDAGAPLEEGSTEAVILVFDPARGETFTAATEWWSALLASNPGTEGEESDGLQQQQGQQPAVKLCVAHGANDEGDDEENGSGGNGCWRAEAEAWCVDNAFELIEVSSSAPPPSSSSDDDGSTGGIARLRDALSAHAWPGLVLKSPEEVEAARRAAVAEAEEKRKRQRQKKEGGGANEEGESEYGGAYVPPPPPPLAALHDEGDDDFDLLVAPPSPRGAAGAEGLEQLLRSLAAARAAAATLSDEERRERAAEMALRLAEALGIEDGESEEEEGDRNDEEEEERRRRQQQERREV